MQTTETTTSASVPGQREPVHDAVLTRRRRRRPARAVGPQARRRQPARVAALVGVVGILLTTLSTYAAAKVDYTTEERLLDTQTRQVGAVLSTAVLLIQTPLATAISLQSQARPGDTAGFRRSISPSVGADRLLVSASIWQRRGNRLVRLDGVGARPLLPPRDAGTQAFLRRAIGKPTPVVRAVSLGNQRRIAYAQAGGGFVVYAERAIPASRRSPVDRDSAFSELHYAIYLGPRATAEALSTTDVAPASLPFEGDTSTTRVPIGDTVLTVITSPRQHLGSELSRRLPLLLLVGGLALTLAAARGGQQLVRRRQRAEDSAAEVTDLLDRVEVLYGQQRELSVRLQLALLPPVIPEMASLEVAVEYAAGAHGVDIGGDWYSLVALDENRFAFVVGDVSGRGIDAVATMARARFTLRAYLLRGDAPEVALAMCSHQFDISADGHIVTAVVGIGDRRTGEIRVANAGHPTPLLLTGAGAGFVETLTGPPLGTGPTEYAPSTFTMPPGSTLFCFTDGLVERRNEDIDTGMTRLADTVAAASARTVDELVQHTVGTLRSADADDDIAVLAIRRTEDA